MNNISPLLFPVAAFCGFAAGVNISRRFTPNRTASLVSGLAGAAIAVVGLSYFALVRGRSATLPPMTLPRPSPPADAAPEAPRPAAADPTETPRPAAAPPAARPPIVPYPGSTPASVLKWREQVDNLATVRETERVVREGRYHAPSGAIIPLPPQEGLPPASMHTLVELRAYQATLSHSPLRRPPQTVEVVNASFLQAARHYAAQGLRVAVCTLANNGTFGGGARAHGSNAAEECLARQSTMLARGAAIAHQYPLDGRVGYIPYCHFFRSDQTEEHPYEFLENLVPVDFIASAAWNLGKHRPPPTPANEGYMRQAILAQLLVAHQQKADVFIPSAFGCGAFGWLPEPVAEFYRQVIADNPRLRDLKVVFAIIGDHNSGATTPFATFRRVLAPLLG